MRTPLPFRGPIAGFLLTALAACNVPQPSAPAIEPDAPAEDAPAEVVVDAIPKASAKEPAQVDTAANRDGPAPVEWALTFRPRNWFGYGSSWLDDVDGDGWHDLAVPDSHYSAKAEPIQARGIVLVLSGKDGHLIRVLEPEPGEQSFGWATATTGDLDGDQVGELLIFGRTSEGAFVRALSPKTGRVFWERHGVPGWTWVSGMSGGVDSDHDGLTDVLIYGAASEGASAKSNWAGLALLSGRNGQPLFELTLEHETWFRQSEACFVGDLDGDKREEFAINAYAVPTPGHPEEFVEVRSGASGALLRRLNVPDDAAGFGHSLAAADVEGGPERELFVTGSHAGEPCIFVFDLANGELIERIDWPATEKAPSLVSMVLTSARSPSGSAASQGSRGSELGAASSLSRVWPGSDLILLVGDDDAFIERVAADSLRSGKRLWDVDIDDEDAPEGAGLSWVGHLGSVLIVDSEPDESGRHSALTGTANHHWDSNHRIWCFDPLSGTVRFVLDARTAYGAAGLYVLPRFPR